jgi:diacylglycerol O-acyltransferase
MAGIDAKFLYSETRAAHMHTLKLVVLDCSGVPGGYEFDELVRILAGRLDGLPPFRRRVVPVPLGLGHPVWVEDPTFDITRHVERRRLDPPAGDRELAALVADVAERPLPRDRPLWQIVVAEGLPDQRLAVIAKIHHALADGAATVALLSKVLGGAEVTDGSAVERAPSSSWQPDALPSRRQLLALAARAHATRARSLPSLAAQSARGLRASRVRRRSLLVKPPLPFDAPRTSFNASLVAARTYAMATLALDDLKAIRAEQGATLNDVYLAVCAGALRRYLTDRDELPTRSLVASVPVATGPGADPLAGNHVDNLFVSIGTDIAEPLLRLRHIATATAGAKDVRSALGNDLLGRRAEVVPPQLYALSVRAWERSRLANHLPPPLNLVLSNVPGPRQPLRFGPSVIEALYSVGPILEGIGLNITAWSYVDAMYVSVLGSPSTVPDPWPLADALAGSLSELKAASGRAPGVEHSARAR